MSELIIKTKLDKFNKQGLSQFDSYDIRIKEYANGDVEMKSYSRPIFKKVISEKPIYLKKEQNKKEPQFKEIRNDNKSRSYQLLVDYAIENSKYWNSFVTLTFKENITNLDEANKKFNNAMKTVRRKYKDFMYLGVPEFQKNGKVHYHLLTNLMPNSDHIPKQVKKPLYNEKTKTTKTLEYYDLPWWSHGYSSAFDLSLTDDKFSVSAYMTKYFYKDIDNRLWGRNKVLKSNNLAVPNEKTYTLNSQEFKNYMEYLEKYKKQVKEKHIIATNPYAPSMTIYNFKDK